MPSPDYSIEASFSGIIAGIDEVGRGPWAGPVVAAAVILDINVCPEGIDDSKKIKPARREALYTLLLERAQAAIGIATVEEIDALNILQATKLAMRRAFDALPVAPDVALIDGNQPPQLPCRVQAVIGGDGRSLSIAAASIVAKVTRDRLMAELAQEFPMYGWERNAGYGTAQHQRALATHGVTKHHRRSFAPVRALLEAAA